MTRRIKWREYVIRWSEDLTFICVISGPLRLSSALQIISIKIHGEVLSPKNRLFLPIKKLTSLTSKITDGEICAQWSSEFCSRAERAPNSIPDRPWGGVYCIIADDFTKWEGLPPDLELRATHGYVRVPEVINQRMIDSLKKIKKGI